IEAAGALVELLAHEARDVVQQEAEAPLGVVDHGRMMLSRPATSKLVALAAPPAVSPAALSSLERGDGYGLEIAAGAARGVHRQLVADRARAGLVDPARHPRPAGGALLASRSCAARRRASAAAADHRRMAGAGGARSGAAG